MTAANSITLVAYATPGYARFIPLLRKNAAEIGCSFYGLEVPEGGSYTANVNMKPKILASLMDLWPTGKIIYTDVDTLWRGIPEFPADLHVGLARNPNPNHKNKIAASALFLDVGAPFARTFVEHWRLLCKAQPSRYDHPLLTQTIDHYTRFPHAGGRMEVVEGFDGLFVQNGLDDEKPSYG
jgi:hypothetical protein